MSDTLTKSQVIEKIRLAFKDVSRGDGITLHEACVIDDYGSGEERRAARLLDTDNHWTEIPKEHLNAAILAFLDIKGFRYYLPAYMIWTLENFEEGDSISIDATTYHLDISPEPNLPVWAFEKFKSLSASQCEAVPAFLYFLTYSSNDLGITEEPRAL